VIRRVDEVGKEICFRRPVRGMIKPIAPPGEVYQGRRRGFKLDPDMGERKARF